MSDLWDYGPTSSGDSSVRELTPDRDSGEKGALQRYLSPGKTRRYRHVLDSDEALKDIRTRGSSGEHVGGCEILCLPDESSDEDGFEKMWRRDKEEMMKPVYESFDDDSGDDDQGKAGGRKKKRQREPEEEDMEGLKAQNMLRSCLQDDEVSSLSGSDDDDDEIMKRVMELREKRKLILQQRERAAGDVEGVCDPERLESGAGTVSNGVPGNDTLIELRFVDKNRHEFTTDAVATSTFDFPCSVFVKHAVEQGWINCEEDILKFVFDDEALDRTKQTPQMYDMEDGDTIDVHYKH